MDPGSDNSIVMGVTLGKPESSSGFSINSNQVLLKRIRAYGYNMIAGNNVVVTQSYIDQLIVADGFYNLQLTNQYYMPLFL